MQLCLSLFLSLVFVMLVNLLIAMMGDTYTRIAEIKNEWMRQVKLYSTTIHHKKLLYLYIFYKKNHMF